MSMGRGKRWGKIAACIGLFFLTPMLSGMVMNLSWAQKKPGLKDNMAQFREMKVDATRLDGYTEWNQQDYCQLAEDYLYYDGEIVKKKPSVSSFSWFHVLVSKKKTSEFAKAFQGVMGDVRCFPVAKDVKGKATLCYEDSWGNSRSYGGNRIHEGTDIMASNNQRGYFPVVSVSDGVVEKKGWLQLGGYRIGVRSSKGTYFYYAHLHRYADGLEEGSPVKAGQLLGYMGDSGYGKEGTVGKFDVHLHFGIYVRLNGEDVSVNPYPILKQIEE